MTWNSWAVRRVAGGVLGAVAGLVWLLVPTAHADSLSPVPSDSPSPSSSAPVGTSLPLPVATSSVSGPLGPEDRDLVIDFMTAVTVGLGVLVLASSASVVLLVRR